MKFIPTILTSIFVAVLALQAQAQKGTLAGKIVDKSTSEEIIGGTVAVEGQTIGTSTDIDGRFFLKLEPGTYTIVISYVSYRSKKYENISILPGQLTSLNVELESDSKELEEIVVKGETRKESSAGLLIEQRNATAVSSGVSADLIKRLPDRTTADVIKRVSGTTVQDGKFAIIRGMTDRYNYGMINGAPLPSSEPDRKAFSLDLIPAQAIDNMMITKTATPDKPGDFAGGLISITTRDIPDENSFFVNIGGGYHSITTFRDFYRGPQSGASDVLGFDAGKRSMPDGVTPTEKASDPSQTSIGSTPDQIVSDTRKFNNDFTPRKLSALPNASFQIGASRRLSLAGNDLGILAAVTYANSNIFEPYERNTPVVSDRFSYVRNDSTQGYFYQYDRYRSNVNAGLLLNFTYKVGLNNKFYFKNLLTQVATDQSIFRSGNILNVNLPNPYNKDYDIAYFYQSNRSYFSQIGGEHLVWESRKLILNYALGYTNIFMKVPDFKRNFSRSEGISRQQADTSSRFVNGIPFSPGSPNNPGRFFFDLNEHSISANGDASIRLNEILSNIKLGGMLHLRSREFVGRNFNITNAQLDNPGLFNGSIGLNNVQTVENVFKNDSNIAANRFYQVESTQKSDRYSAGSALLAFYIMAETKITPTFRVIYGLRNEIFNQRIQSNSLGKDINVDTTWIDPLPSINVIYTLIENLNLRAGYSRTLSRPEYREFAPLAFYDFTRNSVFVGNPGLTRARIHNLDLKLEYYPSPGETFSINPFAKFFTDPVESSVQPSQGGIAQLSYVNAKSATNYGVEFEARKNLGFFDNMLNTLFMKNITVFGNLALIRSIVDQSNLGVDSTISSRPLQGQSPYVFNAGIQYSSAKDFNITLAVNEYGKRIVFIAQEEKFLVWEAPRTVADFSVSKTFNKKLNAKFTWGDIFAQPLVLYYDLNDNGRYDSGKGDEVFEKYRRGSTASVSLGYTF